MAGLPRAVLFDLDDTIISAYGRPLEAWRAVVAEFDRELAPLEAATVVATITSAANAFWADDDNAARWRKDLRAARRAIVGQAFAQLGAAASHRALQDRLADRFSDFRDEEMKLFPDAHETIDALRARGVKLALITNGAGAAQRAKITRFALETRFDHFQIEGEHDFGKPDPRAYHHALNALGVIPQDAWIVGDNLEWEVIAPQKLGMYAIWYDPHGDGIPDNHPAKPDRIVRSLTELLG